MIDTWGEQRQLKCAYGWNVLICLFKQIEIKKQHMPSNVIWCKILGIFWNYNKVAHIQWKIGLFFLIVFPIINIHGCIFLLLFIFYIFLFPHNFLLKLWFQCLSQKFLNQTHIRISFCGLNPVVRLYYHCLPDSSAWVGQEHRPLQGRGQPEDCHHVLHQRCAKRGTWRGQLINKPSC